MFVHFIFGINLDPIRDGIEKWTAIFGKLLEVITFVTLDFQSGYFTVYPTDTANAQPTLLTHCPIFLTHIYFI